MVRVAPHLFEQRTTVLPNLNTVLRLIILVYTGHRSFRLDYNTNTLSGSAWLDGCRHIYLAQFFVPLLCACEVIRLRLSFLVATSV